MMMGYLRRSWARTFVAVVGSLALASSSVVSSAALAATTATACAVCGFNLINNPGAEVGPGAQSDTVVNVPGWTRTEGSFTAASYAWSGGDLSAKTPGPPNRGNNYFYGGPDAAVSVGTQTISLAAGATVIDGGALTATLDGWLGGYAGQEDDAALSVIFRSASGQKLRTLVIGPVTAAERNNVSGLVRRSATTDVPVGTTSAVVFLVMTRYSGSDNDGLADNLSLVLTPATGLVVDPGTSTAKAAAAVALDGAAEGTTVTVSLKDKDGAPVAGKVVALTARAGLHPITVAPVSARTDAAGVASFTVTDPATGTVGFAAIDETDSLGVGQPVLVSFVDPFTPDPTASRVSVSPTGLVPADGTAFATVTATLLNGAGGPVVGVQADLLPGSSDSSHDLVAPARSASALTYGLTKTNANGQASFTVSSTQAGTATYTVATSNDVHGTFNYQSSPLSITFTATAQTSAN
jgi:hypothetical protein